ncbi:MAG: hypothetical protein IPJ18_19035 [Betaproteobacteria bacterium]|nr:hypothetical protein [Betaproteobacteria bacterium]
MIATAASCSSNFVALLIDEAQAMTFREWSWLLGLQNAMDWEGYRLSVFSIASHQMDYTYELLGKSDHAHVAARFLVAHWPFPGISSAAEVEYVLKGYDEASEWPDHSGISYLAHFAPEPFARGARLAPCAGVLWQVLHDLLPKNYQGDAELHAAHRPLGLGGSHLARKVDRCRGADAVHGPYAFDFRRCQTKTSSKVTVTVLTTWMPPRYWTIWVAIAGVHGSFGTQDQHRPILPCGSPSNAF